MLIKFFIADAVQAPDRWADTRRHVEITRVWFYFRFRTRVQSRHVLLLHMENGFPILDAFNDDQAFERHFGSLLDEDSNQLPVSQSQIFILELATADVLI